MHIALKTRLLSFYQQLKASFWLIPFCMLLASIIIALAIVEFDLYIETFAGGVLWTDFLLSVDGARMILSSIAGSMITVASLVFSMTLVALSLVAQQLGPRILQIFMEDRPTQIVLGLFIATFLFAMIILGAVGVGERQDFIPRIGVFASSGLAVIAFGAVIFFVHHIARQIQADVIIFSIAKKLDAAAEDYFNGASDLNIDHVNKAEFEGYRSIFDKNSHTIYADKTSGYAQHIEIENAICLAEVHDLKIDLLCRPGDFLLKGCPLMKVVSEKALDDELYSELMHLVQITSQRTRQQRVEFEMMALVEIAVRALSKGINDPFTAISCIDWLSVTLAKFVKHYPNYRLYRDKDDIVRLLECPQTFEYYLGKTFSPISNAAADTPMVLSRLRKAIADLRLLAVHDVQRRVLDEELKKLGPDHPPSVRDDKFALMDI
jgi:uncharacterized membrane protein